MRFAGAIKAMRSEPTYSVMVIRRSDDLPLAALIGCKPSQLDDYLAAPPYDWDDAAAALTGSRST